MFRQVLFEFDTDQDRAYFMRWSHQNIRPRTLRWSPHPRAAIINFRNPFDYMFVKLHYSDNIVAEEARPDVNHKKPECGFPVSTALDKVAGRVYNINKLLQRKYHDEYSQPE